MCEGRSGSHPGRPFRVSGSGALPLKAGEDGVRVEAPAAADVDQAGPVVLVVPRPVLDLLVDPAQGLPQESSQLLLVHQLLGQFLLTAALRYGAVASVIVMDYSSLVWATLLGWWVFDLLPPASTWLGAPLIVGAGLLIAWREHRLSLQKARAMVGE